MCSKIKKTDSIGLFYGAGDEARTRDIFLGKNTFAYFYKIYVFYIFFKNIARINL